MSNERIDQEAAGWLVRQQDDAMDWAGFTAWLEEDPRHRDAFDQLALLDARLDVLRGHEVRSAALPEPANDRAPLRWGRVAGWGGSAIAAAIALVLVASPPGHAPVQHFQASPGQTAQVALADGTKITLAPSSALTVDGASLALNGTGYFDVPHRPGRTMRIQGGDFTVSDIGTRFAVANELSGFRVDVESGEVAVSSPKLGAPVRLVAGRSLFADRGRGIVRMGAIAPSGVAAWRSGKLTFDQASLALVTREITRYSGRRVTVDPAIADRTFSGVLAIENGGSPERALAQIMSLDARTVDGGVRLEPRR